MNCRNCGAAMALHTTRSYFFCNYCGAFHFPEGADEGIRPLGPAPDAGACPGCAAPLVRASLDEAHRVLYCDRCRGVLVPRKTFAEVVQRRRAWASGPTSTPAPLGAADLARRVECPSCQAPMLTHPYYGPGNIVIDACETCDAIWLDYGELRQVVSAPGRDRGSAFNASAPAEYRVGASAAEEDDDEHRWASRRRGRRGPRGEIDVLDVIRDLWK